MKYILPWGLIFSRVLSAPLVIYLARLPDAWVGPVVVAIIWFALIGDILGRHYCALLWHCHTTNAPRR